MTRNPEGNTKICAIRFRFIIHIFNTKKLIIGNDQKFISFERFKINFLISLVAYEMYCTI